MFRRYAALFLLPVALTACAQMYGVDTKEPQVQHQAPVMTPPPAPKPLDPLAQLNSVPGVTVYPLNTPPSDPFTRKNLQPVTQKVLGEGYFVSDPSVNVYPPRLPQAIHDNVPMEGVRVDAAGALYSGKIRAQEPPKTVLVEPVPAGQPVDDMSGGVIAAQPLPPVIGERQVGVGQPQPQSQPQKGWGGMPNAVAYDAPPVQSALESNMDAWGQQPSLATAPATHAFTPAGSKSGPVNTGYNSMPVAPPVSNQPAQVIPAVREPAPQPVAHTPPDQGPGMQPPTSFDMPSTSGVIATPAPELQPAPQGAGAAIPSLTGY